MIGKSFKSRVILLIIAVLLFIILGGYGVSSEIMLGVGFLVVLRVILLLAKLFDGTEANRKDNDK